MAAAGNKVRHFIGSRIMLLLGLVLMVCAVDAAYRFFRTLQALDAAERLRDRWQRPAEIMSALHLREGSAVAEIGCGAGYFALKLAPIAGETGTVFAEDILNEPLVFLWVRARSSHRYNIHVVKGAPEDPHLPIGVLDAVLIANTYHEFRDAHRVLTCSFSALRAGGRLVIADRGPVSVDGESRETEVDHHELNSLLVEREVLEAGFNLTG